VVDGFAARLRNGNKLAKFWSRFRPRGDGWLRAYDRLKDGTGMSYESNRTAIERLLAATRDRDESALAAAYAADAVIRQSGVPESLGGVLRGRNAIAENFRRQDPFAIEVRLMFGDDSHVCVVGKLSGIVSGTEKLKGANQPFSTYECAVYTLRDGLIEEQLTFVNWLDAYVQADLVSLSDLLA
jgi:ketosteroid isomerase-like protein